MSTTIHAKRDWFDAACLWGARVLLLAALAQLLYSWSVRSTTAHTPCETPGTSNASALHPHLCTLAQTLAPDETPMILPVPLSEGRSAQALRLNDGSLLLASSDLAPDSHGFNGPLTLGIHLGAGLTLRKFIILDHNETPAYLEETRPWQESLLGLQVGSPAWNAIDTVSGATYTSRGIKQTIEQSARQAHPLLHLHASAPVPGVSSSDSPDLGAMYLTLSFLVAILFHFRPGRKRRTLLLLLNVILGGFLLNAQYSLFDTSLLLYGPWPPLGFSPLWILAIAMPVILLFTGNLYCGHLCPFGSLQELLSRILPRRWHLHPHKQTYRYLRSLKYLLLTLFLLSAFAPEIASTATTIDPLTVVWPLIQRGPTLGRVILGVGLILCLFIQRPYCRILCPAGAFLSLSNRIRLLRKYLPWPRPPRCPIGVRHIFESECIWCDNCRTAPRHPQSQKDRDQEKPLPKASG